MARDQGRFGFVLSLPSNPSTGADSAWGVRRKVETGEGESWTTPGPLLRYPASGRPWSSNSPRNSTVGVLVDRIKNHPVSKEGNHIFPGMARTPGLSMHAVSRAT